MTRSIRLLLSVLVVALVWVQTASAWHEAEHALHGHAVDELACEILSGTAEQPADLQWRCVVSTFESRIDLKAVHKDQSGYTATTTYRSRAPPAVR